MKGIRSPPIKSRFSVKLKPLMPKEEIKAKSFGNIFAKIPQDLNTGDMQEFLSMAILPENANLGLGSTNQIAKIMFPTLPPTDESKTKESKNVMNIPIISQPFGDYKILVATAPKNIKLGKGEDDKPVVVYIVFSDDADDHSQSLNIPSVYFVTTPDGPLPFQKKKEDPVIVVDSNRTVTGLKSKAMAKFVKFKNKMTNRFEMN